MDASGWASTSRSSVVGHLHYVQWDGLPAAHCSSWPYPLATIVACVVPGMWTVLSRIGAWEQYTVGGSTHHTFRCGAAPGIPSQHLTTQYLHMSTTST